ncbi:hypothetical protein ACHAWU_010426 [Discostella pseudostelligera]|uniref:Uncharacterized protein n=1 Tax=Discostella pseudostelligera TaxID=259834 RepID=A0ABD3MF51_9STRA
MWSSSSTSSSTSEGSVTIKGGGGAYHPWVAWTRFHLYPNEDDPLVIKDTTSPVTAQVFTTSIDYVHHSALRKIQTSSGISLVSTWLFQEIHDALQFIRDSNTKISLPTTSTEQETTTNPTSDPTLATAAHFSGGIRLLSRRRGIKLSPS